MYVIRLWKDLDFAEFALADRDFALEGRRIAVRDFDLCSLGYFLNNRVILISSFALSFKLNIDELTVRVSPLRRIHAELHEEISRHSVSELVA